MDYKTMKFEDILEWCKANNQIPWLKETLHELVPTVDKHKNPVLDEEGQQVYHDMTFIELKLKFCKKFMSEILPKAKEKKPTMLEILDTL